MGNVTQKLERRITMSMENKIDSRELLVDEVSESTHFSHVRARKFFYNAR